MTSPTRTRSHASRPPHTSRWSSSATSSSPWCGMSHPRWISRCRRRRATGRSAAPSTADPVTAGAGGRANVSRAPFGTTPARDPVDIFTLTNAHGLELRALTYGGTIVSLSVPDRNGAVADVVLGHDSLEDYISDTSYFGAIIGRYANRIADARF